MCDFTMILINFKPNSSVHIYRTECTLSEFAVDTELGLVDAPDDCVAIQILQIIQNLDRLEKWAKRNLTKFNKGKYQVLHLRRNKPRHYYMLAEDHLCKEGPGRPGGHRVEHKPALCP